MKFFEESGQEGVEHCLASTRSSCGDPIDAHGAEQDDDVETFPLVLDSLDAAGESLVAAIRARQTAWGAEELADVLKMDKKHIYKLAKQQRMPSYRIGGSVRFDPGAVADWLEKRSVG